MPKKPIIIFILGPTGVGKSSFAVKLARKISGEIISCDSMQVYKHMPILSQQAPAKLRRAVPHHLVSVIEPSHEWSASEFIKEAERLAKEITLRKKIPIITGGTGLYARALMKGLFPSPPKDEKLRKALYEEAKIKGSGKLYERLLKVDPEYASKIHPNDLRRIVRALEVHELTGRPLSEKHKLTKGIESKYKILIFILTMPREELYERINGRVEEMFERGIAEEVKKLKSKRLSKTAKAALGYKEVSGYLAGKYGLEEAKEILKKNTRHYAKRQIVWFKREEGAKWLELGGEKRNGVLLKAVVGMAEGKNGKSDISNHKAY